MLVRLSGADSQCAETMRIARGLGRARAHECSSVIQAVSSNTGGAPWLTYSDGSGPSSGVQRVCGDAASSAAWRSRCSRNGWRAGEVWAWRAGEVWAWRAGEVWAWRTGEVWAWRTGALMRVSGSAGER